MTSDIPSQILQFPSFLMVKPWLKHYDSEVFTIWLFNIAMENPPIFKFGKPSISIRAMA